MSSTGTHTLATPLATSALLARRRLCTTGCPRPRSGNHPPREGRLGTADERTTMADRNLGFRTRALHAGGSARRRPRRPRRADLPDDVVRVRGRRRRRQPLRAAEVRQHLLPDRQPHGRRVRGAHRLPGGRHRRGGDVVGQAAEFITFAALRRRRRPHRRRLPALRRHGDPAGRHAAPLRGGDHVRPRQRPGRLRRRDHGKTPRRSSSRWWPTRPRRSRTSRAWPRSRTTPASRSSSTPPLRTPYLVPADRARGGHRDPLRHQVPRRPRHHPRRRGRRKRPLRLGQRQVPDHDRARAPPTATSPGGATSASTAS